MDPCPLCRHTDGERLASVPYSRIWDALENRWQADFSAELVRRLTPGQDAVSYRCRGCGLEYFSPVVPGDGQFYEELSRAGHYYDADRWEFRYVAKRVSSSEAVVDFGCGSGMFVRQIATSVRRAVGVDHNPGATSLHVDAKFELQSVSFSEFAQLHPSEFDVVTAFQVIEHLSDVAALCEPAQTCVRRGGRVFLSVPNVHRTIREPFEPLDLPPHHVSRWSADQLRRLADTFGLELVAVHREPFVGYEWAAGLARGLLNMAALAYYRARGSSVSVPLLSMHGRPPEEPRVCGHALLAEFRRT